MITSASLKSYRLKDLAQLAKKRGVVGWHSMNKDQLIRAITQSGAAKKGAVESRGAEAPKPTSKASGRSVVKEAREGAGGRELKRAGEGKAAVAKAAPGKAVKAGKPPVAAKKGGRERPVEKARNPRIAQKIQKANAVRERQKDLATPALARSHGKAGQEPVAPQDAQRDRIVLLVRDPYWLHACWEITRPSVLRAQAAMAEHWHTARPVLRVLEVENTGTTSSAERVLREIPIHGGVQNWYIDVVDPPKSFRVDIGYRAANGKFFGLAKSNAVTTPRPGSADSSDDNWSDVAENAEKIYAQSGGYAEENNSYELQELFEERLQRPMGSPLTSRFGAGAERMLPRRRDFLFDVDAEMVVFGSTKPDAHVSLSGEPVKLRPDGTFSIRLPMPDKRQVIPVVAASRDGLEQRTVVIAIERNTKVMEPMIRESND